MASVLFFFYQCDPLQYFTGTRLYLALQQERFYTFITTLGPLTTVYQEFLDWCIIFRNILASQVTYSNRGQSSVTHDLLQGIYLRHTVQS